jgi:two-component system, NtrC family, sensor kinase
MNRSGRSPGFTLIELLVVIVVVGILATVAISVFWRAKDRSLVTTLEADLRTVAAKQEEFFEASMTYATQEELLSGHSLSHGRALIADREELTENIRSLDETNRMLTEARDAMIRAEKMASVGRLGAGIAHEVGNPLGAIIGYLG